MKRLYLLAAGFGVLAWAAPASAATWAQGTTPRLSQIFALDVTGEPGWIYGAEDVAGDGLGVFNTQEQQRDLRTAYAAADANRFWARVYVSDANAVDPAVTVFVFIDSDKNTATGGGTVSADLSAAFTTEKSLGGFEYVIGVSAATPAAIANVWSWSAPQTKYVALTNINAGNSAAEIGQDADPIGIGTGPHGYVQGRIDLNLVGLTPQCDANLYVRSAATSGPSDLDMSLYTSCVPAVNGNRVPVILQPTTACTTDAQCPQNGVCQNGQCVIAPPCATTADCPANMQCTVDGRCVPIPSGTCTTNAQCTGGLVCTGGQCGACTQGGAQCGAGMTCAPNGTCVGGTTPTGTGHVEGGAFNCAMGQGRGEWTVLVLLGIGLIAARARRRTHNG